MLDQFPQLRSLSPSEKMQLIDELWSEIEADPQSFSVSDEHKRELDRRNDEYEKDPSKVVTWEAIKARLVQHKSTP